LKNTWNEVRMHKRQVGKKLLQKHQKQSLTKCQRVDYVGYGSEWRFWGIYSLCLWGLRPDGAITSSGHALHWEQANRSRASGRFY